jgi:hypothetical protein
VSAPIGPIRLSPGRLLRQREGALDPVGDEREYRSRSAGGGRWERTKHGTSPSGPFPSHASIELSTGSAGRTIAIVRQHHQAVYRKFVPRQPSEGRWVSPVPRHRRGCRRDDGGGGDVALDHPAGRGWPSSPPASPLLTGQFTAYLTTAVEIIAPFPVEALFVRSLQEGRVGGNDVSRHHRRYRQHRPRARLLVEGVPMRSTAGRLGEALCSISSDQAYGPSGSRNRTRDRSRASSYRWPALALHRISRWPRSQSSRSGPAFATVSPRTARPAPTFAPRSVVR